MRVAQARCTVKECGSKSFLVRLIEMFPCSSRTTQSVQAASVALETAVYDYGWNRIGWEEGTADILLVAG